MVISLMNGNCQARIFILSFFPTRGGIFPALLCWLTKSDLLFYVRIKRSPGKCQILFSCCHCEACMNHWLTEAGCRKICLSPSATGIYRRDKVNYMLKGPAFQKRNCFLLTIAPGTAERILSTGGHLEKINQAM